MDGRRSPEPLSTCIGLPLGCSKLQSSQDLHFQMEYLEYRLLQQAQVEDLDHTPANARRFKIQNTNTKKSSTHAWAYNIQKVKSNPIPRPDGLLPQALYPGKPFCIVKAPFIPGGRQSPLPRPATRLVLTGG
nr:hypothetical protein Iba_chr08bCG13720 [Ipomoea batatas]